MPTGVGEKFSGNAIRFAKVVKARNSSHSLDVVYADDGTPAYGVQISSPHASSDSGLIDIPKPTEPDQEGGTKLTNPYCDNDKRDVTAIVAMVGVTPVVIGYVFPQVNHLAMPDDTHMKIDRHGSDFVTTTEKDGNFTMRHPSGSYVNIGNGAPPAMEGKDYDKVWTIRHNTKSNATIELHTSGAHITISPGGTISIQASGTVTVQAGNLVKIIAPKIELN